MKEIKPDDDRATTTAKKIIDDLSDRRGIGDELDDMRDEIVEEMIATIADIIRTAYDE